MISKHLIIYILIGFIGAAVDFSTFLIINVYTGLGYIVANTMGSLFGMINNFILNFTFNYKLKNKHLQRFALFCSAGLIGILGSNLIIFLLVELMNLQETLAKTATLAVVVALQYTFNRLYTFRKELDQSPSAHTS
ncbi:hypothetical protein GKC30_02455 [Pseudodesulfovibrio sp. F-1]|uniref:GtrA/DPMS transmembrane domain-containing protein n=1 Tax=Pseudodesulfovibrio alkaliphilus TaxID=2661613 RepID=A0A7K1KKM5_9BACT|nr:GtrA family protein [Pseudodesulfovibrio alkaliphilus]MUM76491.1 hypothetical protein [Pseudodesulfovibrio alkaliphilus]